MGYKAAGLMLCQFLFLPDSMAEILRRAAILPAEKHAERSGAFKANAAAYISNADIFLRQQFFCSVQPYAGEVLVRCFFIYAGKQAVKMKPG